MTETLSHLTQAKESGAQSITEGWTAEHTMEVINALMAHYPHELSEEIMSAFAQGIVEAARSLKKVEGE